MTLTDMLREVQDYLVFCDKQDTCPRPYGMFHQDIKQAEFELGSWFTEPMLVGVQLYRKPWNKHEVICGNS